MGLTALRLPPTQPSRVKSEKAGDRGGERRGKEVAAIAAVSVVGLPLTRPARPSLKSLIWQQKNPCKTLPTYTCQAYVGQSVSAFELFAICCSNYCGICLGEKGADARQKCWRIYLASSLLANSHRHPTDPFDRVCRGEREP